MRAFHYSWWSFFIAFFVWFAAAPLLPEIRKTLQLSKQDIWTTNIVAVCFDVVMRFVFGAICDQFGARIPMGIVLMLASIPVALTGLVQTLAGLTVLRLFIGIAGSSFVMCQCWSTRMFTKEIVGKYTVQESALLIYIQHIYICMALYYNSCNNRMMMLSSILF